MCSCGGLLTEWCLDCGDETCPYCGCPCVLEEVWNVDDGGTDER